MALPLILAALVVILLVIRAARQSGRARQARMQAGLPVGELVSIDSSNEDLSGLRQENIISARYGISGRPDRIVKTVSGIVPVELKSGKAPRTGPHKAQLAQLAVYCLLIEDQFQTTVVEGIIEFSDSSITVPFNSQMRAWILSLIDEVQEAKQQGARPRRSHNQPGRCRGCGFRESCREALH